MIVRAVTPKPREDVVAVLEGFLAKAKAGEITAVGVAATQPGGGVVTQWSRSDNVFLLLAAAEVLCHRIKIERVETR